MASNDSNIYKRLRNKSWFNVIMLPNWNTYRPDPIARGGKRLKNYPRRTLTKNFLG